MNFYCIFILPLQNFRELNSAAILKLSQNGKKANSNFKNLSPINLDRRMNHRMNDSMIFPLIVNRQNF